MNESGGIDIDISRLPELSRHLSDVVQEMHQLVSDLGGVFADTGRADSDRAGCTGPGGIGTMIATVREALANDTDSVRACAVSYAESEGYSGPTLSCA